jgi:hypothetical protein
MELALSITLSTVDNAVDNAEVSTGLDVDPTECLDSVLTIHLRHSSIAVWLGSQKLSR